MHMWSDKNQPLRTCHACLTWLSIPKQFCQTISHWSTVSNAQTLRQWLCHTTLSDLYPGMSVSMFTEATHHEFWPTWMCHTWIHIKYHTSQVATYITVKPRTIATQQINSRINPEFEFTETTEHTLVSTFSISWYKTSEVNVTHSFTLHVYILQ